MFKPPVHSERLSKIFPEKVRQEIAACTMELVSASLGVGIACDLVLLIGLTSAAT